MIRLQKVFQLVVSIVQWEGESILDHRYWGVHYAKHLLMRVEVCRYSTP